MKCVPPSLRTAFVAGLVLVLAACGTADRVSPEAYDQIEIGMTLDQVESIMGGAGEAISWPNQPDREQSYRWLNEDTGYSVTITIVDSKVAMHVSSE